MSYNSAALLIVSVPSENNSEESASKAADRNISFSILSINQLADCSNASNCDVSDAACSVLFSITAFILRIVSLMFCLASTCKLVRAIFWSLRISPDKSKPAPLPLNTPSWFVSKGVLSTTTDTRWYVSRSGSNIKFELSPICDIKRVMLWTTSVCKPKISSAGNFNVDASNCFQSVLILCHSSVVPRFLPNWSSIASIRCMSFVIFSRTAGSFFLKDSSPVSKPLEMPRCIATSDNNACKGTIYSTPWISATLKSTVLFFSIISIDKRARRGNINISTTMPSFLPRLACVNGFSFCHRPGFRLASPLFNFLYSASASLISTAVGLLRTDIYSVTLPFSRTGVTFALTQ